MASKVEISRPGRWDNPFGPDMSEAEIDAIIAMPAFAAIDPENFPGNLTLRDIVGNDARVLDVAPGEIIHRKGAYGNSIFVVIDGAVRIVDDPVVEELLGSRIGRGRSRKKGFFATLGKLLRNPRIAERRNLARTPAVGGAGAVPESASDMRDILDDHQRITDEYSTIQRTESEMFSEAAALSRMPHSATVYAETQSRVLELRWQGLRDLRHWDPGFRDRLDQVYRDESLLAHLREVPLFNRIDDATLERIAGQTLFESYGEVEWSSGYKNTLSKDANEVIASEPVITRQESYVDGLLIVRTGFARVTERLDQGHMTVGFLSQGEAFGLEEIVAHARGEGDLRYTNGLRAVGYVDVLRIPTVLVEEHLLPLLLAGSRHGLAETTKTASLDESMLNFLVNNRTINGTAVMAIDTNRCTGCDDCVRACAAAHDNNPRFVRHGPGHANLMVASACMHCVDAVCLIGCPTGAIHRAADDGTVFINDDTCIGCAICADSCPYDNIRMVEIRDGAGAIIVDEATQAPIVKATKCDLCQDISGGPACQRACPHDALVRIDARDRDFLSEWINR